MQERPNLVLMHTHDTGRHLGCYGAGVPTPNLSRMALEGVLFRQCHCVTPSCSASRSGLMTSLSPHNNGMLGLCHRGWRLKDPRQHLSNLLREAGYRTQLIGFQHEVPGEDLGKLGYDGVTANDKLDRHSVKRAELAVEWLAQAPRQPFFLNVGFVETHRTFPKVEPPEDERYAAPFPWLPDDPRVRKDVAELNTAVRHVDAGIGLILEALERHGLARNTLVIYTTDHGVPFPRAKSTLYDAGTGVALAMRGPGGFEGGKVIDGLVSHLDLLPTFFNLAEVPVPSYAQGVNLLPMVRGQTKQARQEVFTENTYHGHYEPMRAIRTERYKYIRNFEDQPPLFLPNIDNGYSKNVLTDAGLPVGVRSREQLFDLAADPQEFENLAARAEYAAVRADLEKRLLDWMTRTDDPLLKGPVPLVAGGPKPEA